MSPPAGEGGRGTTRAPLRRLCEKRFAPRAPSRGPSHRHQPEGVSFPCRQGGRFRMSLDRRAGGGRPGRRGPHGADQGEVWAERSERRRARRAAGAAGEAEGRGRLRARRSGFREGARRTSEKRRGFKDPGQAFVGAPAKAGFLPSWLSPGSTPRMEAFTSIPWRSPGILLCVDLPGPGRRLGLGGRASAFAAEAGTCSAAGECANDLTLDKIIAAQASPPERCLL
jgi:hypothetical protein